MEDFEEPAAFPSAQASTPRRSGRRRLLLGGIALTVMLSLAVGVFLASPSGVSQAQAAAFALRGARPIETPTAGAGTPTAGTGTPGPCSGDVTVTHVSGKVITVTRPDGSTAHIYVTSRTHYTESGKTVTESAVKVGSKVYVVGSCTSHGGRINATSIQIMS